MSTIRVIYTEEPKWPAADNHPDAVRYVVQHPARGELHIDALGGEPTLTEIDAILRPAAT